MLYNVGDVLICKLAVNTQCLEMTNPCFDIMPGDKYIITDKDDYTDDNECHWYEFTSKNDENIVLNVWNDNEHMIIDESFEIEKE